MIFDTDVLIHASRGHRGAADRIDRESDRSISLVTRLELLQGLRNAEELRHLKRLLLNQRFEELPLTPPIGQRAASLLEKHVLADGLGFEDALIAATALEAGLPLTTSNHKHFKRIAGLDLVRLRV